MHRFLRHVTKIIAILVFADAIYVVQGQFHRSTAGSQRNGGGPRSQNRSNLGSTDHGAIRHGIDIQNGICRDGWVSGKLDNVHVCFKVNSEDLTWDDAKDSCRKEFSFLLKLEVPATIRSTDIRKYLQSKYIQDFWTGLHEENGYLVWDEIAPHKARAFNDDLESHIAEKRIWDWDIKETDDDDSRIQSDDDDSSVEVWEFDKTDKCGNIDLMTDSSNKIGDRKRRSLNHIYQKRANRKRRQAEENPDPDTTQLSPSSAEIDRTVDKKTASKASLNFAKMMKRRRFSSIKHTQFSSNFDLHTNVEPKDPNTDINPEKILDLQKVQEQLENFENPDVNFQPALSHINPVNTNPTKIPETTFEKSFDGPTIQSETHILSSMMAKSQKHTGNSTEDILRNIETSEGSKTETNSRQTVQRSFATSQWNNRIPKNKVTNTVRPMITLRSEHAREYIQSLRDRVFDDRFFEHKRSSNKESNKGGNVEEPVIDGDILTTRTETDKDNQSPVMSKSDVDEQPTLMATVSTVAPPSDSVDVKQSIATAKPTTESVDLPDDTKNDKDTEGTKSPLVNTTEPDIKQKSTILPDVLLTTAPPVAILSTTKASTTQANLEGVDKTQIPELEGKESVLDIETRTVATVQNLESSTSVPELIKEEDSKDKTMVTQTTITTALPELSTLIHKVSGAVESTNSTTVDDSDLDKLLMEALTDVANEETIPGAEEDTPDGLGVVENLKNVPMAVNSTVDDLFDDQSVTKKEDDKLENIIPIVEKTTEIEGKAMHVGNETAFPSDSSSTNSSIDLDDLITEAINQIDDAEVNATESTVLDEATESIGKEEDDNRDEVKSNVGLVNINDVNSTLEIDTIDDLKDDNNQTEMLKPVSEIDSKVFEPIQDLDDDSEYNKTEPTVSKPTLPIMNVTIEKDMDDIDVASTTVTSPSDDLKDDNVENDEDITTTESVLGKIVKLPDIDETDSTKTDIEDTDNAITIKKGETDTGSLPSVKEDTREEVNKDEVKPDDKVDQELDKIKEDIVTPTQIKTVTFNMGSGLSKRDDLIDQDHLEDKNEKEEGIDSKADEKLHTGRVEKSTTPQPTTLRPIKEKKTLSVQTWVPDVNILDDKTDDNTKDKTEIKTSEMLNADKLKNATMTAQNTSVSVGKNKTDDKTILKNNEKTDDESEEDEDEEDSEEDNDETDSEEDDDEKEEDDDNDVDDADEDESKEKVEEDESDETETTKDELDDIDENEIKEDDKDDDKSAKDDKKENIVTKTDDIKTVSFEENKVLKEKNANLEQKKKIKPEVKGIKIPFDINDQYDDDYDDVSKEILESNKSDVVTQHPIEKKKTETNKIIIDMNNNTEENTSDIHSGKTEDRENTIDELKEKDDTSDENDNVADDDEIDKDDDKKELLAGETESGDETNRDPNDEILLNDFLNEISSDEKQMGDKIYDDDYKDDDKDDLKIEAASQFEERRPEEQDLDSTGTASDIDDQLESPSDRTSSIGERREQSDDSEDKEKDTVTVMKKVVMRLSSCFSKKQSVCYSYPVTVDKKASTCEPGWYGHVFINKCYKAITVTNTIPRLPYTVAKEFCKTEGGKIASIEDGFSGKLLILTILKIMSELNKKGEAPPIWVDSEPLSVSCNAITTSGIIALDCNSDNIAVTVCEKDVVTSAGMVAGGSQDDNVLRLSMANVNNQLSCPIQSDKSELPTLWFKDGRLVDIKVKRRDESIFPHLGGRPISPLPEPAESSTSVLALNSLLRKTLQRSTDQPITNDVFQGKYWCEVWSVNPFKRRKSDPQLIRFTDVMSFVGTIQLPNLPHKEVVLYNMIEKNLSPVKNVEEDLNFINGVILPSLKHQLPNIMKIRTYSDKIISDDPLKMKFYTFVQFNGNYSMAAEIMVYRLLRKHLLETILNTNLLLQLPRKTPMHIIRSINLRSTVSCPQSHRTDPQTHHIATFPFSGTNIRVNSIEMCEGERAGRATCKGDFYTGVYWDDISIIKTCSKSPSKDQEADDSEEHNDDHDDREYGNLMDPMTPEARLKELAEMNIEDTNVEGVMEETADIAETVEELTEVDIEYIAEIMDKTAQVETPTKFVAAKAMQTVDKVLSMEERQIVRSKKASRIIDTFEKIVEDMHMTDDHFRLVMPHVALQVFVLEDRELPIIGMAAREDRTKNMENPFHSKRIFTLHNQTSSYGDIDAAIELPQELVEETMKEGKKSRLFMMVYKDGHLFQDTNIAIDTSEKIKVDDKDDLKVLNSYVISASIGGKKIKGLKNKVKTVFRPMNDPEGKPRTCAYYDFSLNRNQGGWSTDGCVYDGMVNGRDVCLCDHLTNFAVLMDFYGQAKPIESHHEETLSILTLIGLSLSILGLSLTIISFVFFKKLRQGRAQQTLFNLALAMLCSWVIFLVGIKQTYHYFGCVIVAILLHYFILASFMWMLMEAFLQYLTFVKVLGTYVTRYTLKTVLLAWGLPLIPIICVLSIDYTLYKGGDQYCWMSLPAFYYGFSIPVGVIIICNLVVFIVTICSICKRPHGLRSNQSKYKLAITNLQAAITSFVLLGLSWILGYLAISDARLPFQYAFTIMNSLQGFFIFVLFIVRKKQVRDQWLIACCCKVPDKQKSLRSLSASASIPSTCSARSTCSTSSTTTLQGRSSRSDSCKTSTSFVGSEYDSIYSMPYTKASRESLYYRKL